MFLFKMKRKSLEDLTTKELKVKTWDMFSKYIRRRDCLITTGNPFWGLCITCGKRFNFRDLDAGHFTPGRGNAILFDERGVHAQCHECNRFNHGEEKKYREKVISMYGIEIIEEIEKKKNETLKFTREELINMFEYYKDRFSKLLKIKPSLKKDSYEFEIMKNLNNINIWDYK